MVWRGSRKGEGKVLASSKVKGQEGSVKYVENVSDVLENVFTYRAKFHAYGSVIA